MRDEYTCAATCVQYVGGLVSGGNSHKCVLLLCCIGRTAKAVPLGRDAVEELPLLITRVADLQAAYAIARVSKHNE